MKKGKKILVAIMAMAMIFSNFAIGATDPNGTASYPHVGEGASYNYNTEEGGTLSAALSHGVSADEVDPGEGISALITAEFISGQGDGSTGEDPIKDLLLVLYDPDGDLISDLPSFNEIGSRELGEGESLTLSVNFNAPTEPGTYTYEYGIFDYGNFGNGWQHAYTKSGTFQITVREPEPETYEVKVKPTMYEMEEDGTLVENEGAGYITISANDVVLNAGISSGTSKHELEAGTELWFEAFSNTDYEFLAWKHNIQSDGSILVEGDSGYRPNPRYVETPEGNKTYKPTPVFVKKVVEPVYFTIYFDANGGTLATEDTLITVEQGGSFTAPTPTRSGYTFNGWTYDPSVDSSDVQNSSEAVASWSAISNPNPPDPDPTYYTITINSTDGGSASPFEGSKSYPAGIVIMDIDGTADDGFTFTGLTGDTGNYSNGRVTLNGDLTFTANFEEDLPDEPVPEEPVVEEPEEVIEEEVIPEEIVVPEVILDEIVVEEEELPEAGGVATSIFYAFGSIMTTAGMIIKKKKI